MAELKTSPTAGMTDEELFSFVEYQPESSERIGFSNYSYWGSVWNSFKKKKIASVMFHR